MTHYSDLDERPRMVIIDYEAEYYKLLREREILLDVIQKLMNEAYGGREGTNNKAALLGGFSLSKIQLYTPHFNTTT